MGMRGIGVTLGAAVIVAALTGCTVAQPRVVADSIVRVAVEAPLTSITMAGSAGSGATNAAVASMTHGQFYGHDAEGALVADPSFGTVTHLPGQGFDVRYSLADTATWSDGVALGAADLLLSWVVSSGALDSLLESGFDSPQSIPLTDPALFPTVGDDGRSITVHYGTEVEGWQTLIDVRLAAHELAGSALGIEDAEAASDAVIEAVLGKDSEVLADLADAWNAEATARLASGPYELAEWSESLVTLSANNAYRGSRQPLVETIELVTIADPHEAIAAFAAGEVDVVIPTPVKGVRDVLLAVPRSTVLTDGGTAIEHLDLQIEGGRSGVFADPLVRRAFLLAVPREQLVTEAYDGAAPQASFLIDQHSPDYASTVDENGSAEYADPDPTAAAALLAEAGVSSPEVCVLFDAGDDARMREFQLIAEAAARAGFIVTDCSVDDVASRLGAWGAYDAALFAWDPPQASTRWLTNLYSSDGPGNLTGYSSADVDARLAALASTADASRRAEILAEIDSHLWADAYGAPLFAHPSLVAFNSRVTGITNSRLPSGVFWDAAQWVPATDG